MRTLWVRLSCFLSLSSTCLLLAWTPTPTPPRAPVNSNLEETSSRREFLGVAASVVLLGSLSPTGALAAGPATTAEAIRRSAANIPGYGPTDVFFPESWLGQWRVQRQVSFGGNADNTVTLDYLTRFLPSVEDGAVVVDRGFAQANLEAAVASSQATPPSFQWTYTNPNDLRLAWTDGRRKDIKVTQRATDYQQVAEGRLWSSEVQRVTSDGGSSSVPMVTARRVVTQYRWEANNNDETAPRIVQALEVIYDLGGSDPLQSGSGSAGNSVILSKSRILMQKVEVVK